MLENLGAYKEAIASYEQSIELKPDNLYQVWANRGVAYGKFKGYQSQINAYSQALQFIQCNTHPNYWGLLCRDIGRRQNLADWLTEISQLPQLEIGIIDRLTARITNMLKEGGTIDLDRPTKYSHPYYWAAFTLTGEG